MELKDQKVFPFGEQEAKMTELEGGNDPFPDPPSFSTLLPSRTPSPTPLQLANSRLDASLPSPTSSNPEDEEEENERKRQSEKNSAALTLEMVGDLPFAEVRPPENILFVCKLNPVTRSEDLELIFSRFGKVLSCEVVKDRKTGDSLQYAFIEFDEQKSAEQAYFKMQSVLIDDRRIQVDFSQSVSKLHGDWLFKRSGGKLGNRLGGDERSQSSRNGDSRRGGGMVFDFDDRERNRGSGSGRRDDRRDGRRRDDKDDRRRDGRDDRRRDDRDDRRQDGDDRNRSRGGSSYQTSRNDHQSSSSRTKSRWDDRDGRKEEVRREKRDGRRERSPRDSRSGRDERGREDHSGR